jgi:hypothetical protein
MKKKHLKSSHSDTTDYSRVVKRIKLVSLLPKTLSMVVYGRSGTGKTTFSASFPKPLLLLDMREDGTDSIADRKEVSVARVETWEEFEQLYWYLKSDKHKFNSAVIDTVTELQDMAIAHVAGDREPDEVLSQRVWGQAAGLLKTWLLNYRDLTNSGHLEALCIVAHDRRFDNEDGGGDQLDPEVGPRLMPSVSSYLCGMVKVIGNTYIKEKKKSKDPTKKDRTIEYRMRIGAHAYYTTKMRKPKDSLSPESILNPSYERVVEILAGDYKPKKSKSK